MKHLFPFSTQAHFQVLYGSLIVEAFNYVDTTEPVSLNLKSVVISVKEMGLILGLA